MAAMATWCDTVWHHVTRGAWGPWSWVELGRAGSRAWFMASQAMPPVIAPSPITAMLCPDLKASEGICKASASRRPWSFEFTLCDLCETRSKKSQFLSFASVMCCHMPLQTIFGCLKANSGALTIERGQMWILPKGKGYLAANGNRSKH